MFFNFFITFWGYIIFMYGEIIQKINVEMIQKIKDMNGQKTESRNNE